VRATLLLLVGAGAWTASAWDLNLGKDQTISFHGFASQGFLASTEYNYLGETEDGSFQFTEMGLNATYSPFKRTRIAVQGFTFDLGNVNNFTPFLDYASIEYVFNDKLGVRAGRIRRPAGIYNHIQDIDLARTSILLPQGLYDARWRDYACSLDGAELFGTIPLGKAGSLGYELFGGLVNLSTEGGVARQVVDSLPPNASVEGFNSPPIVGAQVWWYTPINGLRAGLNYNHIFGLEIDSRFPVPGVGTVFPLINNEVDGLRGSVEYLWKSWTFQAEYKHQLADTKTATSSTFMPTIYTDDFSQGDAWFALASYRFNKWVEAGAYYTEYYKNIHDRDNPFAYQKDLALSLRFDPTSWWVLKVEGHCLRGTGLLQDNAHNPIAQQDDRNWFMLALKTTFSF